MNKQELKEETNPLIPQQITRPEDLEVGREYRLIWKGKAIVGARTERLRGESLGYQWFTDHKIWACDNNPQAFDRWDIYGPIPEPTINLKAMQQMQKEIDSLYVMKKKLHEENERITKQANDAFQMIERILDEGTHIHDVLRRDICRLLGLEFDGEILSDE